MSGGFPARLPLGFIEGLMASEVNGFVNSPHTPFEVGQQVTISGGAFDGLIGRIMGVKENERIMLLLNLLGQETRINVPATALLQK